MRSNPLLPLACLLLSGSALWAGEITLENEHLRVSLDRRSGAFSVLDKQAGVRWVPFTSQAAVGATDVALMGVQRGVSYAREFGMGKGRKLKVRVQITVPDKRRDVCVAITADNDAEVGGLAWPPALVPEKGESSMALAPYGNGLLLPLRRDRLPRMWWRSDMPFFAPTTPGWPSGPSRRTRTRRSPWAWPGCPRCGSGATPASSSIASARRAATSPSPRRIAPTRTTRASS